MSDDKDRPKLRVAAINGEQVRKRVEITLSEPAAQALAFVMARKHVGTESRAIELALHVLAALLRDTDNGADVIVVYGDKPPVKLGLPPHE